MLNSPADLLRAARSVGGGIGGMEVTMSTSRTGLALAGCALAMLMWPAGALAQSGSGRTDRRWSAHAGPGFTLSPTAFHFDFGAEYAVTPGLGIGPLMQIAADDDILILAPTANVRYGFDLSGSDDEFVSRLRPYVQGGLGLAYVEKDRRGRNPDDTEFLLNGGAGVEYAITEELALGHGVMFNGMPADDAVGEDFFFSWQLLTFRYRF